MKKLTAMIMAMAMTLSLFALLTGCGSDPSTEGTSGTAAQGGSINAYIWTEYVPESVIKAFETETGIKVNASFYSSNEELYAKLQSESSDAYDIILPSDYMIEKLVSQDMLAALDFSKLENFKNIGESYKNPEFDPGNVYSVPYLGGVAGIAVNTAKVTKEVKSYADLFDPAFANSIVALDDSRAVIGLTARSLGYSMNTADAAELDAIAAKLLTLKSNIKLYDSDSPKSALISGECSLGFAWSAEIALAMDENADIEIVFPTEGAYLFLDNWAIPKGSAKQDLALQFINYMLKAETMVDVLAEFPYVNPNEAALALLDESYTGNHAKNIPAEVFAKGEYIKNLDTATQAKYEEIWTNLKK
ncbi:MAG: spermidine/putrescine ABC transporter substrate-binding protein [Oscillospiraceae bacterium]|jgi:spermidine/putrescine-binding protein|nr:spermidine/putrescine ABC transporter substrate-binding protein [Oscillospiraceae bacterium]